MKFLIAGFGSIGRRHFRNLLALGERDILLYRSGKGVLPDDELSGFTVETDLQAALAHQPQAVFVTNPTALHLDVAIPAARLGCHLFLEKPLSHDLARSAELEQAVAASGSRALVGYQFRFHPGLGQIARLLGEGAIGKPLSARAHWGEYLPAWHPWEDHRQGYAARPDLGGGVVRTLCHPFDYLRWLLGEVQSLWAFTSAQGLELPVEDSAEIGLRFASGCLGSLHLDYNQRPPSHTLEIIGSRGTLRWDNADGIAHLSQALADGSPGPWQSFAPPQDFERNEMFLAQTRHFIAVAKGQAEPLCTLEDGLQALRLALAALQSAQTGILQHLQSEK